MDERPNEEPPRILGLVFKKETKQSFVLETSVTLEMLHLVMVQMLAMVMKATIL